MGTRRERVVLILDDKYTAGMLKAAGATAMLNRELKQIDPQLAALSRAANQAAQRDLPNMSRQLDRSSSSIDQLSGRLGLAVRAVGAFGPALAPIATSLVPVLAGLVGQIGAVTLGAGVMVTAFAGVGDALEAVNKAALEPTAENLDAAREAMAELEPSARRAVRAMQEWRPLLADIQAASANGFFPGFVQGLDDLQSLAPQVERIFGTVASAAGGVFGDMATGLAGPEGREFISWVESTAAPTLRTFGETAGNVASGLGDLAMAMGPLGGDFNRGLLESSERFAQWADNLSQTEGYREFIAYVRETGPQVVETLGSLANAALQIGEAAAPLGGPVLQALEAVADAVALIADSPLGPPLMTAVTAMSALSLATRTFGAVAATSWAQAARGQQGYIASLRGANGAIAQASAARSGIRAAGVGAATVGASAAGLQYTALGAVAGSVIPGIGTAAGAAAGAIMDMATALNRAEEAAADFDKAINSGDIGEITAAIEAKRKELEDFEGSWRDDFTSALSFMGTSQAVGMREDLADAKEKLAEALEKEAQAAGFASAAHREHNDALRAAAGLMMAAYDAAFAYEDALRRMREETKDVSGAFTKNGDLVHNLTEQQQGAADALLDTGKAWAELTEAERKARGGTKANRAEWVKTAIQLGWGAEEAERYADKLFNIPPNRKTEVELKIAEARARLAEFVTLLGQVKSRSITVTATVKPGGALGGLASANMDYLRNHLANNPADGGTIPLGGGRPRRAAFGATVPHDSLGYADRYPYLLAPGEEVISNRHGQADRHRPLLKAINAGMLAGGGTAERLSQAYRSRDRSDVSRARESQVVARSGPVSVRVFLGEQELTDMVRTEVEEHATWSRRQGRG